MYLPPKTFACDGLVSCLSEALSAVDIPSQWTVGSDTSIYAPERLGECFYNMSILDAKILTNLSEYLGAVWVVVSDGNGTHSHKSHP